MFSCFLGDVVLSDLMIKESALDVLDLPIKLEYGRLGNMNYAFMKYEINNLI
jgi:hypothetical protein